MKNILAIVLAVSLGMSGAFAASNASAKEWKKLFQDGDKKLDGSFSTDYTLRLFSALQKKPDEFLREADHYYHHNFSPVVDRLIDETGEVSVDSVEKAIASIPKQDPAYELGQRLIKLAKAKQEKIVNQNR